MAKVNDVKGAIQDQGEGALVPTDNLKALLERVDYKKRFEEILGKKAAGFISSIVSTVNTSKQLKVSDPRTVIASAIVAATLDLPINPNLGFAHIVPYKGRAQFQMGWKGYVQLAIRTGVYKTMNAAEVYEGELVRYNRITGEMEIDESRRISNKIVGYVAFFRLMTGFEKYLYMTSEQVTAHAKRFSKSFGYPDSAWNTNFDAMALKTVLKLLLSKYGVLSIEIQKAMQFDQGVIVETPEGQKVDYPDGTGMESAIDLPIETGALEEKKEEELGTAIEPV